MTTTPTLAQLVTVHSQFGAELDRYLAQVGADRPGAHNFFPASFDPSAIRQRVLVRRERLRYDAAEARRQEAERREAFADDAETGERLERAYARHAGDEDDGEKTETEVVDWETLRGSLRRGVILGDPGYGKTFLLRHEARRLAAAYSPTSQPEPPIPVFLRLADVAAHLDKPGNDPVQAIAAAAKARYGLSERFATWLAGRLPAANTVLLLDALDEVPADLRAPLREALGRLATATAGTILLTSRIVGYGGPPFAIVQDARSREVDLVAFDPPRITGFIKGWFMSTPDKGRALQEHLRRQPTLRSLARTPLLLTFLCLVAGDAKPLPTTRAELYGDVLRILLEGKWRAEDLWEKTPARIRRKLRLLQGVAWHFATHRSAWRDLLPEDELDDLIEAAPDASYLLKYAPDKPTGAGGGYRGLLNELSERDGVLVVAGAGGPGEAVPYLFLHRTLHEYLVARQLAAQPAEEWQARVGAVGVFDADWIESIILLAGCLEDPNPFIATLLDAEGDPFHQRHLLAARCIGEAGADRVKEATVQAVADHLTLVLLSAADVDQTFAARALADLGKPSLPCLTYILADPQSSSGARRAASEALGKLGDPTAIPPVAQTLTDPHAPADMRVAAASVLGRLGDPAALPALVQVFADPQSPAAVRREAAYALGELGDSAVIPYFVQALANESCADGSWWVCLAAAFNLGRLGDPAALPALLRILTERNAWLRVSAAGVFRRLGDPAALPALAQALADPQSPAAVRRLAASVLGRLGDPTAIPPLAQTLTDPHAPAAMRRAVAEALGGRGDFDTKAAIAWSMPLPSAEALGRPGDPAAIPALIQALADPDAAVRHAAAHALAWLGDPAAFPILAHALADSDAGVRRDAAIALGDLGDPAALPHLVQALADRDGSVRVYAAYALGYLGDSAAISPLLQAFADRDGSVRVAAAYALGRLGDPAALPHLTHALNDPAVYMCRAAAEALGRLGDPTAIPALVQALADREAGVRVAAAEALGRLGDPAALPPLTRALADPKTDVRRAAVHALGRFIAGDQFAQVSAALLDQWPTPTDLVAVYPQLRRLAWRMKSPNPFQPVAQAATDFVLAQGLIQWMGRVTEVEAYYRRTLSDTPDDANTTFDLADLLVDWPRRAAEAEQLCRAWLAAHDSHAGLLGHLAWAVEVQGRAGEAATLWQQAADQTDDPGWRALRLRNAAGSWLNAGDLDRAQTALDAAVALEPDAQYLTLRRADLALAQGDPAAARDLCRTPAQQHRDHADTQFTYGLALLSCGDLLAAEDAYAAGVAAAELYWLDIGSAIDALRRQLHRQPDLPGAAGILARLTARRDELVALWPPTPAA